jgi:regulator of protease activity HflC (stomatin/prohibitin superfamily)
MEIVWIAILMITIGVLLLFLRFTIGILMITIGMLLLFLRFTKVEEGTAKIIVRWGGVVKIFIQWAGYRLTPEGNVEPVTPATKPWYGGLRVWIGTPFDKVHRFKLRWHSVEEVKEKKVPVFHEEIKDCVMLRPDRYWRKSIRTETRDGMFLDIEWLIGMRCINPEKTIFKSPHNWIENALTQLEPLLRQYIYTKTLEEVLNLTREQIWREIGNDRAIREVLRDEWGIQIDPNEIGIFDVGLPSGYQEALARQKQTELETRARIAAETQEREAEKIELQHVRDRAIEIRDGVKLSPKDAIEVVQTERGKVIKHIIEYKGLEKFRGLPLITIGGERIQGSRERRGRGGEESKVEITKKDIEDEKKRFEETIEKTSGK